MSVVLNKLTHILYEVSAGVWVICVPESFVLAHSKQPKCTILLISTAKLPELYILTNYDLKACKTTSETGKTFALFIEPYSHGTNPVLCRST